MEMRLSFTSFLVRYSKYLAMELLICLFINLPCVYEDLESSLTALAGLSPPSGDTCGSRGDAGAGGGQAHRRHTGCHLYWGGQLQKGNVIVEVLAVVVGVSDGLNGEASINQI